MKVGYCFVVSQKVFISKVYEDYKDAEYAVKKMHGKELHGHRLTVEPAGRDRRRRDSRERRRGPQSDDECWNCGKKGHW